MWDATEVMGTRMATSTAGPGAALRASTTTSVICDTYMQKMTRARAAGHSRALDS